MAKFKASPFYSVHKPAGKINFDHTGEYVTDNADEIGLLKSLSPQYLTVVDEGVTKKVATKTEEAKPAEKPKPAAKAKPSGK